MLFVTSFKKQHQLCDPEDTRPSQTDVSEVGATSIPFKVHAKMEDCMLALTPQGLANAWVRQTCSMLKRDMKRIKRGKAKAVFVPMNLRANHRRLALECCNNILLMENLMLTNHGSDKNVMDEEIDACREEAGAVNTGV